MLKNSFYFKTDKHNIFRFAGAKLSIRRKSWKYKKEINFQRQLIINNIDITKLKPITGELREYQLLCLDVLERVRKVCDDNNLKYWLDSGTLLGAFRHKGFIPWDDDIDLCMLREEYDIILPLLKEEFKNDRKFFVRERDLKENNFQIRIRYKNKNIGLDIFPVDYYLKSNLTEFEKQEITNKIKQATNLLNKKYGIKNKLSDKKIQEAKKELLKIQREIVLNNQVPICEKPALFFGIDFPSDAKLLVFENDVVFPLKEMEFEGKKYFIPNKTEAYLKNFYSDYMVYPESFFLN